MNLRPDLTEVLFVAVVFKATDIIIDIPRKQILMLANAK